MSPTGLWVIASVFAGLAFSTIVGPATAQDAEKKDRSKIPPIVESAPLQYLPNDDEVQKLEKALFNERLALMKSNYMLFLGGWQNQCRPALDSARRLRSAGMVVLAKPSEQIRLLEQLLEFSEYVANQLVYNEGVYREVIKGPHEWPLQQQTLREFRLEIQIELAKLKKAKK